MSRRGRSEGSVYYDNDRQRWIGVTEVTEPGTGKRNRRKVSATTETGAREKLPALRRALEGISPSAPRAATVATVVRDWLDHLPARIKDPTSAQIVRSHGERITRELGRIPVRKLEARDVERLLGTMAADGLSVLEAAGLGRDWQPRETRHSFVSIAPDSGASIEDIADAAGHVNPNVTRAVYRHQISDTVTRAPAVMDRALAAGGGQA